MFKVNMGNLCNVFKILFSLHQLNPSEGSNFQISKMFTPSTSILENNASVYSNHNYPILVGHSDFSPSTVTVAATAAAWFEIFLHLSWSLLGRYVYLPTPV